MSNSLIAMINIAAGPWVIVNDDVMGGRSSARIEATDDGVRFTGLLSLENNGGFASTRHLLADAPAGMDGMRLEVRGDGRAYQLRLRQGRRFDGVAWSVEFDSTGEWQTIELPFDSFRPVFRGRSVPSAGPVDPQNVTQVGIMLADKNEGRFALEVRSMAFFKVQE